MQSKQWILPPAVIFIFAVEQNVFPSGVFSH
jgi:hypothetical protein